MLYGLCIRDTFHLSNTQYGTIVSILFATLGSYQRVFD
jgi:hypothetical protein